ncbi:MAG TPA: hypothetical protein VM865_06455 [Acidobacteriaceae bacterium]|jgi:hypothetical protein|nr:hypothetical protein [Acidobacteriaceae bacterium]
MATKVSAPTEKLYDCEVKRRRLSSTGRGYEPFWKVKTLEEALVDGDTEFRCKHCHGALKLFKRNSASGPSAYVAHKHRIDSEYCAAGAYFREAADGRATRLSSAPVH